MSAKPIRTQPTYRPSSSELTIGGWYDGAKTYLWIGEAERCLGTIEGNKLLRLARAIVKEMEGAQEEQVGL